jgi:hypothetical protein
LERHEGFTFGGLFCGFFWARDLSRIIFQKLGVWLQNSRARVHYPKVKGPLYKVTELNQNNELFLKRKIRGLEAARA